MKKIISITFTWMMGASLSSVFAHPGHGDENPLSPGHYMANPEHFLPLALTIGAVLISVLAYRSFIIRSKQNK